MDQNSFDLILIGGGVIGCSIAYYCKIMDPSLKVAIVEMDPTYKRASTLLSDGNIRVQFNIKENILISRFGLEVLDRYSSEFAIGDERPDVAFRKQGNLFLIDEAGRGEAELGLDLQKSLGCSVDWLERQEIAQLLPFVDLTNVVGGTLGHLDGSMSPLAVLMGYKNKAVSLGAVFIHGKVIGIFQQNGQVTGVELSDGRHLYAPGIVNSSGAWASHVARLADIDLPVSPVKRQVFVFESTLHHEEILPSLFFPSGLYLIHEGGGNFICGKSLESDPIGLDDFSWKKEDFEKQVWPELVDYVPAFDRLKLTHGWAGLYEVNTLDGNAILGEWPERRGFFLANGFSGHGFQQCHAVGRYLAEVILARKPTLDLSIFSPNRILTGEPIFESRRKLI